MMLFGTKLINFVTGFLLFLTFSVGFMIFWMFIVFQGAFSQNKIIISATLSIILALIIAVLVNKFFVKVGVGILGAWTCLSICFLIVPLFHLKNDGTGNGIKWAIYSVFGLIGFVVGVYKAEAVKIYLTAFIGAFFFIRGISAYAGGFPDEFALVNGQKTSIHPAFYGYCVGIVILFVLSVIFQKRYCAEKKESDGSELEEELLEKGK